MSRTQGKHLRVRAMAYIAGEPVPFFWPMRSFIHHNPLHGLEDLPFEQAVEKGARLFHARGFLPRSIYQGYLRDGRVDRDQLAAEVSAFVAKQPELPGLDLAGWLMHLVENMTEKVTRPGMVTHAEDLAAAINGRPLPADPGTSREQLKDRLRDELLMDRPVYEAVDALFGTGITDHLNDLVVRACLDFFDEGQSVWYMPDREDGFFNAWRSVAGRGTQALLDRIEAVEAGPGEKLVPDMVVDHVLRVLGVPEEQWIGYLTREIAHLHGWAGFIRWRATATHYHWSERYPGDLVDLLAVRLTLAMVLLEKRCKGGLPKSVDALEALIDGQTADTYLRYELHSGNMRPEMIHRVEDALGRRNQKAIEKVFVDYCLIKRSAEAKQQAAMLRELATEIGQNEVLDNLGAQRLSNLIESLKAFDRSEGMMWLRAMESQAMQQLMAGISLEVPESRDKRPFVQAAFCIDTRSERIRRHLESVGDYQTFGIAGFFGVPVSLMELGKGSEMHLCPVLLTPKNLVLEMSTATKRDEAALTALEKAIHKLKESVLSPFVTVEAIGLLFGFDMIGKTIAPQSYIRWRETLHDQKPNTHLLLDKMSREQADSILRAVQRAIIVEAAVHELALEPEVVTDDVIRALREAALDHEALDDETIALIGHDADALQAFIETLRDTYRINTPFANRQMEELSRIGFSLEEQVKFVQQALSSIGLTDEFSRFVLLVGHGSTSENNPYESALDCGACGGNHGLVSARVLAQMANKPTVRKRLADKGIHIPDDAWFIPALHNTTTDEITLHDLELLPTTHLVYLDRLRNGLTSAARLCAKERLPSLQVVKDERDPAAAFRDVQRNAMDWSQVRPEWGLSRNAYFVIGRRALTRSMGLDGRAFLHSYDYRVDPKRRFLENILTGPLVVGQWINMEHYFSAVDNERFGSGSKVYHNVAGRFGVMSGNLSDLRTGLPSQTVLENGLPYHEPMRLITVIEAPFNQARTAVENVVSVKRLVRNGWIRLIVVDPETAEVSVFDDGDWHKQPPLGAAITENKQELRAS